MLPMWAMVAQLGEEVDGVGKGSIACLRLLNENVLKASNTIEVGGVAVYIHSSKDHHYP